MPILNRSKIRPDVLRLMDELLKEQMNGVLEFLKAEENQGVDFQSLWQKVMEGNEHFFKKGGELNIDELYDYLTKDEMFLLARLLRFAFEHVANVDQERHPIPGDVKVEKVDAGGVPAEWQIVPGAKEDRVLMYIHGEVWCSAHPTAIDYSRSHSVRRRRCWC